MKDDVVIQVSNLTKIFTSAKRIFTAVNDISFFIKKGETVGLLGPNGAGKTTTIHMLLGLITPTLGDIKVFGKDFFDCREDIVSRMNFSSTYTNLPWTLTVWENLYVAAMFYSVPNPQKKVEEIIFRMKLEKIRDKTLDKLSSGWLTRVSLSRIFINDPSLILLDEPTASLDPDSAAGVRKEILKFKKENNATILWTSHNMAEVEEVCDRVIFLQNGKIVAEDTPEGLAKTIKVCRVILMVENKIDLLVKLIKENDWKGNKSGRFITVELEEDDISEFLSLMTVKNIRFSEISIEKPSLNDFFLSVAGKK